MLYLFTPDLRFSGAEMKSFLGKEPDAYVEKPVDPETVRLCSLALSYPAIDLSFPYIEICA